MPRRSPKTPAVQHPDVQQVMGGEAYLVYRQQLAANVARRRAGGAALASVAARDPRSPGAAPFFSAALRDALSAAELSSLAHRIRFLRSWLSQLLGSLPAPEELSGRTEADKAFDKLVKSRFPMLATKEGELVRLQAGVGAAGRRAGRAGRECAQARSGAARDRRGFRQLFEAAARGARGEGLSDGMFTEDPQWGNAPLALYQPSAHAFLRSARWVLFSS